MNIRPLEKLGLTDKEARVYLAVLELGRATAIDIAKRTGIKRTTVYDVILDLINQGFIAEAKRGARRVFIAEDPTTLTQIFEQRLVDIKEIIPVLLKIHMAVISKPKLRFYDGIEGVRHIMEELLSMKGKEQLYWSSISDLVDVFGDFYMRRWVKRRIKKGIWSRVLLTLKSRVPELYLHSNETALREIRWLSQDFIFSGVLCIFDNKIVYISSLKESFGFIVESNEFSVLLRLIFRSMWSTASKSKTA